MPTATSTKWSGIEHEELDSNNWVQMVFKWVTIDGESQRHYKVFGEIRSESFCEEFYFDDTKTLAYDFFWDKEAILNNGCVYCIECGEYATNPEFANAVSQTGGYCLDCAPDSDDEDATRWL